jgi:hypothetical protein
MAGILSLSLRLFSMRNDLNHFPNSLSPLLYHVLSAQNDTYKYNKLEALITTIETIRMYHLSFDFHF